MITKLMPFQKQTFWVAVPLFAFLIISLFRAGAAPFTDANWISMGGIPGGADGSTVGAAVSDGSGNLYIGGFFKIVEDVFATNIAKWDGSSWSALGSGITGYGVYALRMSGSDLYAGGEFTTAGGKVSAYLARAIVNPPVLAIEPDVFGGYFINFSGIPGSAYRLQRAQTIKGRWATSAPQTAPASGRLEFWDVFPRSGPGLLPLCASLRADDYGCKLVRHTMPSMETCVHEKQTNKQTKRKEQYEQQIRRTENKPGRSDATRGA